MSVKSNDEIVGMVTLDEVAKARHGATVTRAPFNPKYLRQAIEILEKLDCEEVDVELADDELIFFIPKQNNKGTINSTVGIAVAPRERTISIFSANPQLHMGIAVAPMERTQ